MNRVFAPLLGIAVVGAMLATPAVGAQAAPLTNRAASYVLAPNPIAPTASLKAGQSVTLTLTAYQADGALAPKSHVWLGVLCWTGNRHCQNQGGSLIGIGTLTVNAPLLKWSTFGNLFQVNSQAQLTMTYTAGTPAPPRPGQTSTDGVMAETCVVNCIAFSLLDDYTTRR